VDHTYFFKVANKSHKPSYQARKLDLSWDVFIIIDKARVEENTYIWMSV